MNKEILSERLEIDLDCIGIGRTKLIYDDYMVSKFEDNYDMAVNGYGRFVHLNKKAVIKKILQIEDAKVRTENHDWAI